MPTIEWNRQRWGKEHPWTAHGDEWSYAFGSATAHWYGFIYPRIHNFLPSPTTPNSRIVEIAPGHGRWTQFLLGHSKTLAAYDIAESCLEHCRKRFKPHVDRGQAAFYLTDGLTLAEKENSVDFVFSYDSLEHVERDVMQGYLTHISKCLKPGGFALLQHSNLGEYRHLHNYKNDGPFNCRGASVSAGVVSADARAQGLDTLIQEALNHETQQMNNELTDCISLIQKPTHSCSAKETLRLGNPYYWSIAELTKAYVQPYELCKLD